MVKEASKVISEFNELVNMTPEDLKAWLETEDSKSAGWTGSSGDSGETVGHDSGNKIIKILESNPDRQEDKYAEEDIDHMRKVVSYCKRHLAQEEGMKERKSEAELKETKSYKSLKNWGHDSLKKASKAGGSSKKDTKKEEDDKPEEEEKEEKKEKKEKKAKKDEETPAAGDKRKADEAQDEEEKAEAEADAPEPKKAKEDEGNAGEKEKETEAEAAAEPEAGKTEAETAAESEGEKEA